jgi:FKBP-type peptidyl-prolyl cis-trans isomerase
MKKGTIAQITCPASLAYGEHGSKSGIKPGETIYFDLEVIDFRA